MGAHWISSGICQWIEHCPIKVGILAEYLRSEPYDQFSTKIATMLDEISDSSDPQEDLWTVHVVFKDIPLGHE